MSTYARPEGGGAGGAYIIGDPYSYQDANQMKGCIDHLAKAVLQRNIYAGGTKLVGIAVSADGDVDLLDWVPLDLDNTSNQFSAFSDANGALFIAQYRFEVRVSDAAITVTPKLRYGATYGAVAVAGTGTVATISGAAACGATSDDYSGTDQYQTITLTVPTGNKIWKPQLTVAGTGGNSYTVWGRALRDIYISS